ncbi:MAG TPA: NAD(P)H-dependent oxidoreductase [Candidatus Acidoferrales bacterium]|nr:NAD(P)H-dependent oxidoreductase [Candidatus Acidoferrales bacterium]
MRSLIAILAALAWCAPAQQPVRVLVSYYSQTGNTEKLAGAIGKGAAQVKGVDAAVKKVAEVKDAEILQADGILLGTPVQWSNMAAPAKHFLDRVGDVLWKAKANGDGKTAGAFCTGGGAAMGKDVARLSIISAFLTMRFTIVGGVDDAGFGTMGTEATTGPADPGVSEKELEEARRFGQRFAEITLKLRGR